MVLSEISLLLILLLIWNSCRKFSGIFIKKLYRVLGNGMKSLLWEDSISGTPCLSSVPQLHEIMNWSKNKGLIRLADICMWDYDGNWSGWNFPDLPVQFNPHKSVLISHLSGLAQVHSSHKDRWGWRADDFYSAAKAFKSLLLAHISSFSSAIR